LEKNSSMNLRSSVAEEIQRTPIAAISAACGVVIAALGLALAWVQFRTVGQISVAPGAPAGPVSTEINFANVFLVISYFLAASLSTSLLLRAIARRYDLAALFASIPMMALVNFSAILVVYLAPPRQVTAQLFASAQDLVFYGSASILIAVCGPAVLADIASVSRTKKPDDIEKKVDSSSDGLGILFLSILILLIWGWLVSAGQTRLTKTFLPEITHPVNSKPAKAGA
jgi:hypothetical protein